MSKASEKYLLSLILFGSNGIVASLVDLPSVFVVLLRTLLGALALAAALLAARGSRDGLASLRHPRQALYLAASGAALGVGWLFLFEAYRQIGVGIASLAYYCGPVIVMALSPLLFHERLTSTKVMGFAAVICGAFLVVGQGLGGGLSAWGLICGGMSAVMYAVMVICSKRVKDIAGVECSAVQLGSAALAVLAFVAVSVLTGSLELPLAQIASLNLPAALCLGLVNTGLGCYLYFSSMGELPVQRVAVCGYLEPLSAVLFSALLLGEALTPANVLGAALILGGAIFSELASKQNLRLARHMIHLRRARRLAAA